MTKQEKEKRLSDWIFKYSAYFMALNVINFDKMTVAPEGGNQYIDDRAAFLSGELFSIQSDPDMIELLRELKDDDEIDPDYKRMSELYYEEAMKLQCVPKDVFVEWQKLLYTSHNHWLDAKKKSDYSIFEPYLKKVIAMQKQIIEYRESDMSVFDQLLSDYEPGMTEKKYDEFFNALKGAIPDLIKKVNAAKPVDDAIVYLNYDINGQKEYMKELLDYLHFNKSWSYQGETEHPFTTWFCKNDCRTTTKYLEDNAISAILSTVHECGHAWYAHNVDDKYDGTILLDGVSYGMHESQSRLCENYLGRSRAFWEYNFPVLKRIFPDQLGQASLDDFVKAINVSRPSLVRTEADELTYPMHILIRYEIEKGLFNGTISTEGLDKTWNEMYKKYLGVDVTSDREGILQDDHWADGCLGYFPTYALGTAFAAQFMHKMRQEIDVDDLLRNGHYDKVMEWLKNNIQHYGRRYDADWVIQHATGEPFNPQYFIDYLTDKYTKLYNFD